MRTIKRTILFLVLILVSCSENDASKSASVSSNVSKDSQHLSDTAHQKVDVSSVLDEQKLLFELVEKYNETGDTKNLQGVLDHWESGLKEEYIATFTPLYCGLVSELMGDKKKANNYYKQSKRLALDRVSKPLDDIEYEYGVHSEKELTAMFKLTDSTFDIKEFKSKKTIIQNYWLYISQIALGENKFKEFKEFNNLNMSDIDLTFLLMDFEINKREDIFHLITGWED